MHAEGGRTGGRLPSCRRIDSIRSRIGNIEVSTASPGVYTLFSRSTSPSPPNCRFFAAFPSHRYATPPSVARANIRTRSWLGSFRRDVVVVAALDQFASRAKSKCYFRVRLTECIGDVRPRGASGFRRAPSPKIVVSSTLFPVCEGNIQATRK